MAKKKTTPKPASRTGKSNKHVYFFGSGKADGNRHMKDLLGGKGSGLAEMTNAGLPVPPGFTISTEVCTIYYKEKSKIPATIDKEIAAHVHRLISDGATLQVGLGSLPDAVLEGLTGKKDLGIHSGIIGEYGARRAALPLTDIAPSVLP